MTTELISSPIVLAPPGAGLPAPELWIARLLFASTRARGSRAKFIAALNRERERIVHLAAPLTPKIAARRVLIKRLPGMEDSSRFWSVWMMLDHLRIVHEGMAGIIHSLGQDEPPPQAVSTADVKPNDQADATALPRFEQSCENLLATVRPLANLKTRLRHAHPWFGALDANGWLAMAGFHLGLHRQQVERIIAAA